ncbi:ATP-binding protein [Winogradskyella sp. 3972H.M.0a.05]|uniref:sensor histidine kinase n=1 Tax=Winogradskyella sp. 3972H.M.0a.05 TaxID=2950277 RepID=UPI003394AB9A
MEEEYFASLEQIIGALVYGIIFLVLVTTGLILFFHYSRKKITEKEIEKIAISLDQKQKVLQASIAAQEEERKRIAKDLHDAISAKLNVVSLTTHVLLEDEGLDIEHQNSLNHILDVTTKTLESSRKIAHDLMPPILEKFGLKVALEELLEEFTKSKQIEIESNIDDLNFLSTDKGLHIFRIIQELLNNSTRHGKASLIILEIKKLSNEGFRITFSDNGVGFDFDEDRKKPGIGLQNIESRVAILNGEFIVNSKLNKGSTFIINCNSDE